MSGEEKDSPLICFLQRNQRVRRRSAKIISIRQFVFLPPQTRAEKIKRFYQQMCLCKR